MTEIRILLADNDQRHRESLTVELREGAGFEVFPAASPEEARKILKDRLIHLAIVNLRLVDDEDENDRSGLDLCGEIDPMVARVLLTGHPTAETARQALQITDGRDPVANGYLSKTNDSLEEKLKVVKGVLDAHFEIIPRDRFAVLTSGGDSPGMNAAIWAVVRAAMARKIEVIGVEDGYRGLYEGRFHKLRWGSLTEHMTRGGTFLGSARFKEFRDNDALHEKALQRLLNAHVSGLVVIGGDGSMQGAKALAARAGDKLRTVALPGTIDNDLYGTDMTLGAGSAGNAIVRELENMMPPAHAMRRIFVCEVMGRYSGFLALDAGLCVGADAILIPEKVIKMKPKRPDKIDRIASAEELNSQIDEIVERLERAFLGGQRHALVVFSEGIRKLIGKDRKDVRERMEERMEEWPEDIRPDIRTQLLGYTIRGVRPERFDLRIGIMLGSAAVKALVDGRNNVMVGWSYEHGVTKTDFDEITAKGKRPPAEILEERSKWKQFLELHETMVAPPRK
ncbi:MAG: ATP-dependent 6-phosphofructokinase [bacterium]|nr:ATP-dependent 6-phosphofructokinase [bacterium]